MPVTWQEALWEFILPAAWLSGSLALAAHGYYLAAIGLSFMFFLTGLRVVHNAFHSALGLSRPATDAVL